MSDLSDILRVIEKGVESLKKKQKDREIIRTVPLSKENAFLAKKLFAHKEQTEGAIKNVISELRKLMNGRKLFMASVVEQIEDYECDFEIDYDGMQIKVLAPEENESEDEE